MALNKKSTTDGYGYIGVESTLDGTVIESGTKYMAERNHVKVQEAIDEAGHRIGFRLLDPTTGYIVAFTDGEGRVGELALDPSGQVPQWILDRWALRLGTSSSGASAFQRDALISAFKQRRGQRIGTAGKPVVSLRFDHGWNKFVSTVLPLLRDRGLPCTQMVNSDSMTDSSNNLVTYADIQAMWVNDGVEVANHGASHGTATTEAEIEAHIVGALSTIQANLPHSKVEAYIPGGKTGDGANDFAGRTTEEFYQTTGGVLSMQHHAAVFGYIPGIYRALPQDMTLGGGHISGDTWTLANLKAAVDDTIREGAATAFMFHPALIGTTGNITVADFTALLDYIVSQRNSESVEVLTLTGSLLADPGTSARSDLINNGSFRNGLTNWSATTGWSTATTSGVTYATTTTGGLLRQFESGRHLQQIVSSNRELRAKFRSPDGATVRVSVTSGANGLTTSQDLTLPASSDWVTVRQPFSVPIGGNSLTFDFGRVSGGQVDMTDIRSVTI